MPPGKVRLVRVTTVPLSLDKLLTGQMRYMSQHGFDVCMVSSPGNTDFIVERESCPFYAVEMTRTISPIKDLVSLFKLIRLFKELKPQIVHSHTPKAGILSMLAAKLAGVPIRLHTVAGLPLMESTAVKRTVLETVEKITYACASAVYPNSRKLQEFILKNNYCGANKLKVIGNGSSNGINSEYFSLNESVRIEAESIRKEHSLTDTNFVYVFIGRVVQDKGIKELTAAFTRLYKKFPALRLIIVGPFEHELDPLPEETRSAIESHPGIIHFDYRDDIRPYLAVSDALVFPSYREGFPNVPMQAGCFNLPSIVTNINGCNEVIAEGKNGLIVEPKDEAQLEQAMERMYLDLDLYKQCRRNARQMIIDRYDQKYLWHKIKCEYDRLLSTKLKIKPATADCNE